MKEKITIIVRGDAESEHTTFVENGGKYFAFYTDGYDGVFADDVRRFLEFLGYEVFEVHNNQFEKSNNCIN